MISLRRTVIRENRRYLHILRPNIHINSTRLLDKYSKNRWILNNTTRRNAVGVASAILRSALKIRYWIIGGTVGGGIHMNNVSLSLFYCFEFILTT